MDRFPSVFGSENEQLAEVLREIVRKRDNDVTSLAPFASLIGVAGSIPYYINSDGLGLTPSTAFSRTLLDDSTSSEARTTLEMYSSAATFTAPQRCALSSVAYSATVTLDLSTSNNFTIGALTGAITLANPINQVAGQSGLVFLTQDAVGGRLITWGSQWIFEAGANPSLSTVVNAKDALSYFVQSSGNIYCTLLRNFS